MILRPAGPADAAEVADLDLSARLTALPHVNWAHSPDEVRHWIAAALIPSGHVLVADEGGALAGYIALREGWIDQLSVRPERWRRGIGTALLLLAKERCPRGVSLRCFQSNHPARALYERHGFVAVATSDGDANDENEPDILYSWVGAASPLLRSVGALSG